MDTRFKPRARRSVSASLQGLATGLAADVTPSGFSTELVHPPAVGAQLHGNLTLDGLVFLFEAEVTWSQPGDPRLSPRGRLSARFTRISDEFFEAFRAQS